LIDAHIEEIETGIRGLRREDIGEEAANAEQIKGGKTDEQYAEDARRKRDTREAVRQEARDIERAISDEKGELRGRRGEKRRRGLRLSRRRGGQREMPGGRLRGKGRKRKNVS